MKSLLSKESIKPLRLIEVFTDRQENVAAHRRLWQQIHAELNS